MEFLFKSLLWGKWLVWESLENWLEEGALNYEDGLKAPENSELLGKHS